MPSADITGNVQVHIASDFAEVPDAMWAELLGKGRSHEVFLTKAYQKEWWRSFGRGQLLLAVAEYQGQPIALVPLYLDSSMLYLVGSGGSDYLGAVGRIDRHGICEAILCAARDAVPECLGIELFHLLDHNEQDAAIARTCEALGWTCHVNEVEPAPFIDLESAGPIEDWLASHRTMERRWRQWTRDSAMKTENLDSADRILPLLDGFFDQHVARWSDTPYPSLFRDPQQRRFYRALTEAGCAEGWLRFTRIISNGRPVAQHLGFAFGDSFLWYKPTFDPAFARRSPGLVLLRELLLQASREGCRKFDFGMGDEAFKSRFATGKRRVRNIGLYPAAGM